MNPLKVTEALIEMKHEAVRLLEKKLDKIVVTAGIFDVEIEKIEITPADNLSEIDEEIFLSMTLSMSISDVTMDEVDELLRTGNVQIINVGVESDDESNLLLDIEYTTCYCYDSENGTSYESSFSGPGY